MVEIKIISHTKYWLLTYDFQFYGTKKEPGFVLTVTFVITGILESDFSYKDTSVVVHTSSFEDLHIFHPVNIHLSFDEKHIEKN